MLQQLKLIKKEILAPSIYELTFEGENEIEMKAGQFITFLLDKIGGRAYSILKLEGKKIVLIIKKWEISEGGRGGSAVICDLEVGESLRGVGPAGHFVLQDNTDSKLFICTGTGFVPLYNQIKYISDSKSPTNIKLLFGVRTEKDLFYISELEELKKQNSNFDFEIYLSREEVEGYNKGYTTDFLNKQNTESFSEYYICGAPGMIESSIEILKNNKIEEKNIYFEKY